MHKLTGIEIKEAFLKGTYSATEIAQYFLKRIKDCNEQLGAFLRVCEEPVLIQAKQLDQRKADKKPLGRLAGIPIAVKDNIHMQDEITTCGSLFLKNYRAPFDATAVKRLKEEDALLIGKTNLDEFAMGSSSEHSALQTTRNPWDLTKVPGGSSGGSSAAVAARLCPIALGSDTGGSIRQPAAFCGIVGFKPTYGRISRYGLVAYASSFDQIGPLSVSCQDSAIAMQVMGQHCPFDATSLTDPPIEEHYPKDLKQMTIGVPWTFLEALGAEAKTNFLQSIDVLKDLGATIIDVDLSLLKYSVACYYILATAEASTNLARFDGVRYTKRSTTASSLEELYEMSREEGFGSEVKRRIVLGTFVLSAGAKDAYYIKAQKVRRLILEQHNDAFKKCQLIALPVSPFPAFSIGAIHDPLQMYLADIYTIGVNLAGVPAISVPSGFSKEGLPYGLQLIGPQRSDAAVLGTGYAFEQATKWSGHIPPLYS